MVSADKAMETKKVNEPPSNSKRIITTPPDNTVPKKEKLARTTVENTISPYGVRLGTYKNARISDLSSIQGYGTVEQKQWEGKTILFLVGFPSKDAAKAAVKVARQDNFGSAILVEKLASGRMKSIR